MSGNGATAVRDRARASSPVSLAVLDDLGHGTGAADPRGGRRLKAMLVGGDVVAVSLASLVGLVVTRSAGIDATSLVAMAGCAVAAVVAALRLQGLYLARVCIQRTIEARGVVRAALTGAAFLMVWSTVLGGTLELAGPATFLVTCVSGVLLHRGAYRAWLRTRRRRGTHQWPLLVVGANEEAADFVKLTVDHPELGCRVVGVVGDEAAALGLPRASGRSEDAVAAAREVGATGAVVIASALTAGELQLVTRDLLAAGIHVHVSSGLAGLSRRRVRPVAFAHEPLLYLEPPRLHAWQQHLKRAIDVVIASAVLVGCAPIALVAVLLIKLDGPSGPVLFRQQRVGRDGELFDILKLRTMVPEAESQLAHLAGHNERAGGPLFKVAADPRVTRVGRVLRATSLDELPQLLNVLGGSMSLVGPRPALPSEAEQFDDELRRRTRVKPGITGLWQVEARDHPSFGPYRRLDLFYVENWSLTLDLLILMGTVTSVVARAARSLLPTSADDALVGPS